MKKKPTNKQYEKAAEMVKALYLGRKTYCKIVGSPSTMSAFKQMLRIPQCQK